MKAKESKVEISFAVSLMENLVTPTFVLDIDGFVVIWNKACENLTGLKAEEVIGTKEHWKGFYARERMCLVDLVIKACTPLDTDSESTYEKIYIDDINERTLHADNWCVMPLLKDKKYLAIDAGPIYDSAGNLIAAVESLRDQTELKETQSELEKLSTIDSLTELGNRRYLDTQLDAFWLNALRNKQHLSIMLIDIDYFKKYNDSYGHQMGDECLKKVAQGIAGSVSRALDLVFRYGGEEFCVLLPDTDKKGAEEIARKIMNSLKSLALEHNQSPISPFVTISIGINSCIPDKNGASKVLLRIADKALYEAKDLGRSRFVMG